MDTLEQTIEKANQVGSQAATVTGVEFKPLGPITPESLSNVSPLKVPIPTVSGTAGLGGFMESYLNNQKAQIAEQQKLATAAQAEQSTSGKSLRDTMAGILGIGSERAQLETEANISGKTQKVTDYTNQLEAEQLAMRRQTEKIRKNETGMLAGAVEAEVNRAERESLSKQADLALLQSAANRDLQTAQGIIDRKIELKLEPLKQKLEFDRFFYEENKEAFSKAEEKAFKLQMNADEKALNFAEGEEKKRHDAFLEAAQNGAPANIQQAILRAKTSDEAYRLAGPYVGSLDRRLKLAQIAKTEKEDKALGALGRLPTSTANKVLSIATDFGSKDVVKKYNATVDSMNIVNGISPSSKNPADHQTIVYAFAKSLDPDSVVREGEYATIKKYAQSSLNRYSKEITNALNGTGFLSEKAIKDIQKTMMNNYTSRKPQYDNLYNQTSRVIDNVAGQGVAKEIMVDFSTGLSDQKTQPATYQVKGKIYELGPDGLYYEKK